MRKRRRFDYPLLLCLFLVSCQAVDNQLSPQEVGTDAQAGYAVEAYAPGREGISKAVKAGGKNIPYELIDGLFVVGEDMIFHSEAEIAEFFTADLGGEFRPQSSMGGAIWPSDEITFQVNIPTTSVLHGRVLAAIRHWEEVSPIRFVRADVSTASGKLNFNDVPLGQGCTAELGYRSNYNDIWIDTNCSTGNIRHEIGHALGFIHEHQRTDREGWININWPNIKDDDPFVEQSGVNLGQYDYLSVMHYRLTVSEQFVYDDTKPALIVPADRRDEIPSGIDCDFIGQRCHLSQRDINGVVNRYSRYVWCNSNVDPYCKFTGGTLNSLAVHSRTRTRPMK